MKLVIFTSNSIRHKFFANSFQNEVDDLLVISESKANDSVFGDSTETPDKIKEHFKLRNETEKKIFKGNDYFKSKLLPILYKEVNLEYVYDVVREFSPDVMLVFGSYIIKEPLLSLLEPGNFLNLHLGVSPYYRGSGTNFWPFVNNELEFVGSTILHLDAGIDTGDIILHIRPTFEVSDNVHTIGCKVIQSSVLEIKKILKKIETNKSINRIKQWESDTLRYYRTNNFNENSLSIYKKNLEEGIVEKYINEAKKPIKLVN